MKILLLLLAIAVVVLIGLRLLFGHFITGSQALVVNDKLQACPESPNCHAISIEFTDTNDGIFLIEQLHDSARAMTGSDVIEKTDNYLHVSYTSAVFGFKDDLECLIETTGEETITLHCRSASRVGYSDFDMNRKRIDKLLSEANIRQPS